MSCTDLHLSQSCAPQNIRTTACLGASRQASSPQEGSDDLERVVVVVAQAELGERMDSRLPALLLMAEDVAVMMAQALLMAEGQAWGVA